MKYKKVEIGDEFAYKPNENTKKVIFYEYVFYSLISIFLAIYNTLNIFKICHNLAEQNNFKISGLVPSYSILGGYRDFSDFQWRYYRSNLGLIIIFATIFVLINKLIKIGGSLTILKYSYLIFGLGYAFFLHRIKMIYLIIILYISFSLVQNYNSLGRKPFIAITWIFCIIIKITSEIYDGYSINFLDFLNLSDFFKNPLLGWNSTFGLVMLKIISFNMEYVNVAEKEFGNNNLISMEKTMEHCKECNKGKFCLSALKFVNAKEKDFSFFNFLIYIFYPPFYFSGPIIMYHSFIFQLNHYKENRHNDMFFKKKILYFIQCIFIFIVFEIFNHYLYVNAIMTNKNNKWFTDTYSDYFVEEIRERQIYRVDSASGVLVPVLVNGADYIDSLCDQDYTVFISIKSDGPVDLSPELETSLRNLGVDYDSYSGTGYYNYISILNNGSVVEETGSEQRIERTGSFDFGHEYKIQQEGVDGCIIIDRLDYSTNKPGINIVVYDNKQNDVVDTVNIDIYSDAQVVRRYI